MVQLEMTPKLHRNRGIGPVYRRRIPESTSKRGETGDALYDYLAAHFYWESSAEIEFTDASDVLVIKDADRSWPNPNY